MGNTPSHAVHEAPDPAALPGSPEDLASLQAAVQYLCLPGTPEYQAARTGRTWQLDPVSFQKPSVIASVTSPEEVLAAVRFAMATGVKIQAACGRHTHECMVQGSLCLDLSTHMNYVTVDAANKVVRVGGGARIGEVDSACAPHQLIVPVGRAYTTGCAGQMIYTGAHGYNERMHGLGIDHMIGATVVVTRNGGEIVHCSAEEDADLFWAIKGGGPNLGIVCEMTFSAIVAPNGGKYAAGQRVYLVTGMLGMPSRRAIMKTARKAFDISRPCEYNASLTMLGGAKTNPSILTEFWFGSNPQDGKDYFKKNKLNSAGVAVADTYGVHDYWTGIQRWANGPKGEDVGPGAYYFRGIMPKLFTEAMGKAIADACDRPALAGVQPVVILDMMGGGRSQDAELADACSLPLRPNYWFIILAQWKPEVTGPAGREFAVEWVRSLWKELFELSAASEDGEDKHMLDTHSHIEELLSDTLQMGQHAKIAEKYGANTARLRVVKSNYDPAGIFGTPY